MRRRLVLDLRSTACLATYFMLLTPALMADEPKPAVAEPVAKNEPVAMNELEKQFSESLSGAKLVGFATQDGKDEGKPAAESYSIQEAVKMDAKHWRIKAGMKVGKVEVVFPLLLEVQWAGDTPVITLTDYAVGPLGTFTARVLFYRGRYAGTWSHGAKDGGNAMGGQIYGKIVK